MQSQSVKEKITIRKAQITDFESLVNLINALADYEKLQRPDKEAVARLKKDIFDQNPKVNAYIAKIGDRSVGYAITSCLYSSFLALSTLYIEDVFVHPEYRRQGIGKQFLKFLAQIALENNCGRMEWIVLNWNKMAINFYEKIGAKQMKEWLLFRMSREELEKYVKLQVES